MEINKDFGFTHDELEMVIRLAEHLDKENSGWPYGKSMMKVIEIARPELHEMLVESKVYDISQKTSPLPASFYTAIVKEEPITEEEVEERQNCYSCGIDLKADQHSLCEECNEAGKHNFRDKHSITYPTHSSFKLK